MTINTLKYVCIIKQILRTIEVELQACHTIRWVFDRTNLLTFSKKIFILNLYIYIYNL